MLGGTVYVAMLRFAVSLAGAILLFSLMSEPRYDRKKMIACYSGLSAALIVFACVWYVIDWASCVKMVAFVMYVVFAGCSLLLSRDSLCLSLYKLALTFYLLAVYLIGGIEISVIFFHRNVWADIAARVFLILLIALFIEKRIKKSIRGFGDYVENELDRFSVMVLIISLLFGIGFILNPKIHDQTPYRLFQILMNFS